MNAIELKQTNKSLDTRPVLQGVDLNLKAGSVLGLLGLNGAGKTTLLRCALGLLKPSGGEALVFGHSAWDMPPELKKRIGFVAQVPDLFHWMTAEQMLAYTASFYDNWQLKKAQQLLEEWDLAASMKIGKMSEGQKQRLAIILGLGHNPDLLVLDEPVAALDPLARRHFIRQLIELNIDEGKSILFSTHIVSDLERIAAEVAILRDGKVLYHGEVDDLKERVVRLKIYSENTLPDDLDIPHLLSKKVEGKSASVCVRDYRQETKIALEQRYRAKVELETLPLEDIFLEVNQCSNY